MNCEFCNTKLDNEATFCTNCGKKLKNKEIPNEHRVVCWAHCGQLNRDYVFTFLRNTLGLIINTEVNFRLSWLVSNNMKVEENEIIATVEIIESERKNSFLGGSTYSFFKTVFDENPLLKENKMFEINAQKTGILFHLVEDSDFKDIKTPIGIIGNEGDTTEVIEDWLSNIKEYCLPPEYKNKEEK